ncbi:MAG: SpoVG family protein [Planctomycetales bacterium]|nr:SpoVG family protein [Planctomycetales bacterium]
MEITEIRIKLMDDPSDRLQAFCSITFDGSFVIRDLKIIQGTKGSFVAMPSRKLTDRCPKCSAKNHVRARFCNECGARLYEDRAIKGDDGRAKLYADIAHPINSGCRENIQQRVIEAYANEIERSKLPGYFSSYDDFDEDNYARLSDDLDHGHEHPVIQPAGEAIRRRDTAAHHQPAPHHTASQLVALNGVTRAEWSGAEITTEDEGFGVGIV